MRSSDSSSQDLLDTCNGWRGHFMFLNVFSFLPTIHSLINHGMTKYSCTEAVHEH